MTPVRSVLLLSWRDTGHPQGGGSETYLHRIGKQLATDGIQVTMRTARYQHSLPHEIQDGIQIIRAGGRYTVYLRAFAAMVCSKIGIGSLAHISPDIVIDTQNGLPFMARLIYGRRAVLLVHHCHRQQWPVAGRILSRIGWFIESQLSPRLHKRNQYITVSDSSRTDLIAQGVNPSHIAIVRNGIDPIPPHDQPRCPTPQIVVLSRLVPHKRIEDALFALAQLRDDIPDLHLDIIGDGWWKQQLIHYAHTLHIDDAVTFHGHVSETRKQHLLAQSWVQLLPSLKEGWGLAVIEAAQYGVPTIGYRSSGGLSDSILDGITGLLVDNRHELIITLQELLTNTSLREQLGTNAQQRSHEFSWLTTAQAMRDVIEAVHSGERLHGLLS